MNEFTTLPLQFGYYDETALLDRLTNGVLTSGKQVAFLVGSGLTAPASHAVAGVLGVDDVVALIEQEFDEQSKRELAISLEHCENRYQEAFRFLLGRRGPQAANKIIRRAVAASRNPAAQPNLGYVLSDSTIDEACRAFDTDITGWALTPGVAALGELAAGYASRFGRTILTTNFDPLIGVSIAASGGTSYRTCLHRDGNLGQTDGDGSHIVHLHGYWYGSDTLHTPRQLNQPRPQLRASLTHIIRERTIVVLAYGGWDDAFTQALVEVVADDNAYPEIIWCLRENPPKMRTSLLNLLMPGIDRGRVCLYGGIDCHTFLPKLGSSWSRCEGSGRAMRPPGVRPEPMESDGYSEKAESQRRFEPLVIADGDQPPLIEFYVGREWDLLELERADARVTFITGIGGQGKSALYWKSGRLIELEKRANNWENQAYIRQWIGELLLTRGEKAAALSLLVAALDKWAIISPPKARRVDQFITEKFAAHYAERPSTAAAEKFALRWINQTTLAPLGPRFRSEPSDYQ